MLFILGLLYPFNNSQRLIMQNDNIYNQLGYTSEFLTANSEIANLHPDYADLVKLEADKFYFSGNHPRSYL